MAMTEQAKPAGPFKLVTVNSNPERAKKLCGRLVEEMRATHHIDYVANTTSKQHTRSYMARVSSARELNNYEPDIEGVRAMVEEHKPNLMVRSSPVLELNIGAEQCLSLLVYGIDVDP